MVSTISSTANSRFHQFQTLNSDDNKNHLRDAIFSPYLHSKVGTLVGKHVETSQKLSPFISNRKDPLHQGEKKEEDGEIGVFGAEKYFNEGEVEASGAANIAATKYLHLRDHQKALEARQYKVQYGTPSVRSESTCNSQTALLHSAMMRNSQRDKKNKAQAKSFLAGLGINCSCSDKNSVDTSDHAREVSFNKTAIYDVYHGRTTPKKVFNVGGLDAYHSVKINKPQAELLINKDVHFPKPEKFGVGLNKENGLAFSPVNPGLRNHLVKMQPQLEEEEEEEPRKSLAVFGSPILNHKSKSLSFDKKLTIPSRDAALKMEEIDFTANSGSNYNDAASDASSDLFEIESIKGKPNTFLSRQTSDAASGCVSPTCYAPSEASIEWSVVTASAAVLSDCEEQMSEVTIRSPIRTSSAPSNGKTRDSRETQRRRPGMLLGCKSHKAVRVAGDAFITHEKPSSNSPQTRHRINTSQVARFPKESKLGNYGATHGQHAYATPPSMQWFHSPQASQLLYKYQ